MSATAGRAGHLSYSAGVLLEWWEMVIGSIRTITIDHGKAEILELYPDIF